MKNIRKIILAITIWPLLLACKKNHNDTALTISNYTQGEQMPGGETTVTLDGVLAFSSQSRNITANKTEGFFVGNSFFTKDWVIAPASTTARDGLGPFFNAKACATCHRNDGRGRPPTFHGEKDHGLLLRLSIPGTGENGGTIPDPNYGSQLQDQSVPGVDGKGDFTISYETISGSYKDGTTYELKKPVYNLQMSNYGAPAGDLMISPRVAPQMIGLGLLEALSETQLLENVDEMDSNNDGISGRANYVWDKVKKEKVIGRFGWKANEPNLRQQNADAFLGDIGITTSINPNENCTTADCNNATNGGSPEFPNVFLDAIELYSQTLAPPYRKNAKEVDVLTGKKIFYDLKCTSCHTPSFITGSHSIPALSNQTIFPYTDMLLHDMGDDLSDKRPDFHAEGNEWKTPPLWGIGQFMTVNGHTRYMHDGRARNIEEAILWHDGEATSSKNQYIELTKTNRELLITFLNSL
jgi:CxxC motif-containing protein (DUF1111 family)